MKAKGTLFGVAVFALALILCAPAAGASAKKSKARKKPVEKPAAAETYCPPIDGAGLVGPGSQSGILERLKEKMESTTRGDGLANEGDHEGEAWNEWFFSQRKYPATTLPPDAIGKALRAAKRNIG